MNDLCGGCCPREPNAHCVGAFARIGILKVHWECWSDCNLSCPFCYRTVDPPLDLADGKRLLRIVKTSGVQGIVFTGGDPSLRPDLIDLIAYARDLDLWTEIQTNAQEQSSTFHNLLLNVNLVGVSLDGCDPESHDLFRLQPGNYEQVTALLRYLEQHRIPVVVRSIVAQSNYTRIASLGPILSPYQNVVRWVLMEFKPIGGGYTNRGEYLLERKAFEEVVKRARSLTGQHPKIDVYRVEDSIGIYALITATGQLFGVSKSEGESHPTLGSMFSSHLGELADELLFSRERHWQRYGGSFRSE